VDEEWKNGPRDEDIVTRSLLTEATAARTPRKRCGRYFSELLIEVNWVLRVVPRPLTTAMIASAIPAAMRPYSIAVAPASSDKNFLI
jgi:hypothetical protein